jgi:DNA polymerase-3 subunit delta
MSLSFFYGDEEYLIEQEIKNLRKKLLDDNFAGMNYKVFKNLSYQDFISTIRTQPMMFGNQLIVIDIENLFSNSSFDDFQLDEIKKTFENIPESLYIVFLLIFERNSKKKPDSRKKIYKLISKYATLKEFPSIPTYKTEDLISFINKKAKLNGITIEKNASNKLIEQIGNNLRDLSNEIEKLTLISYPKNKVTEQMIQTNCITNEDIFSFTDKLFLGKKALALKEFRKLCDKQYPLAILSTIQTNLRKVIIMKMNEKKLSISEISKLVGFTDYVVQIRLQELKGANLKDLVSLKRNLSDVEFKIKNGKVLDVQSEIELAFFK